MKIASILLGTENINFLSNNFINYCSSLNLLGHDVTAIFNIESSCLEKIVRLPISIKPIKQSFLNHLFLKKKISEMINSLNPDLIILFNEESYNLAKNNNQPKLYFLGTKNSNFITTQALAYNNDNLYQIQKHKFKITNPDNISYILDVPQDEYYEDMLNNHQHYFNISIASYGKYYTDIAILLRAVANIYYKFENKIPIKIYIYTDSKSKIKLKKLATILNIDEHVIFNNLQAEIIKSDIHLFTRSFYNDVNLFHNISTNNTIALAINSGAIASYINYSTQGIIYKYNNLEELYNILVKLIHYPKYLKNFQTNINMITTNFNKKLANIIEQAALIK